MMLTAATMFQVITCIIIIIIIIIIKLSMHVQNDRSL